MKFDNYKWVLVLWLCLIPLVTWLVDSIQLVPQIAFKQAKNMFAAISHIGVVLLIIGAIVSSVFSEQGIFFLDQINKSRDVLGVQFAQSGLNSDKSIIVGNFAVDIVLSPMSRESSSEMSGDPQMLQYTRPFIGLFWLGGLLSIIGILGVLIGNHYNYQHFGT
jgi:cytochrome c biogenesis factor